MFACAVTTSVLGCLATLILFARYVAYAPFSGLSKIIALVFCILVGCMPIFAEYSFEKYVGKLYPYYRYTLYFIFITAIILLSLTAARDGIWVGLHLLNRNFHPLSSPNLMTINLITVIIALVVGGVALYEGMKVPAIKNIELMTDKVSEDKKIVLLPDLHMHRTLPLDKLRGIVMQVNAQDADTILLIGDMIDDELGRVRSQLDIIKDLKAKNGVYFVTGNHEFYHNYDETTNALKNIGFKFLENNGDNLSDEIFLGGIPDVLSSKSSGKKYDLSKTFAKATDNQFKILMSHTPVNFDEKLFDLEVSGHTHGGQIFPFVVFVYLYSRYVAGMYNLDDKTRLYISRGAGQWGPQMRFLAPAEITVVNIKPQNK